MSNSGNIFQSKWIPIANTLIFALFCYLAYRKSTDFRMLWIAGTIVLSFILSLRGKFYRLGKGYVRWASFPIGICVLIGFLLGTGLIWWILGLFGIFGYEPN